MKILSRQDFLVLPEGAIFAAGTKWNFGGLEVKGETIEIGGERCGYWSLCLEWIDSDGDVSGEKGQWYRLDKMLADGASYPLDEGYTKCLPVDDDTLFLVYEATDLIALRKHIDTALVTSPIDAATAYALTGKLIFGEYTLTGPVVVNGVKVYDPREGVDLAAKMRQAAQDAMSSAMDRYTHDPYARG